MLLDFSNKIIEFNRKFNEIISNSNRFLKKLISKYNWKINLIILFH